MVIENYPNQRKKHCETGTLLNMLKYNGFDGISETMAFGIGSGFNFVYSPFLRMRGVKLPMFRIRPGLIATRMFIPRNWTALRCTVVTI